MRRLAALALAVLAACRPDAAMDDAEHPDAPPGPGEAKLVFFREAGRNDRRDYAVFVDEEPVGFSRAGARFEARCSPGAHLIYLRGAEDVALRAELAAGRTYVLRVSQVPELFRIRLLLEPVPPGTPGLEEMLDSLRREQPIPGMLEAYLQAYGERIEERRGELFASPDTGVVRPEDGRDNSIR